MVKYRSIVIDINHRDNNGGLCRQRAGTEGVVGQHCEGEAADGLAVQLHEQGQVPGGRVQGEHGRVAADDGVLYFSIGRACLVIVSGSEAGGEGGGGKDTLSLGDHVGSLPESSGGGRRGGEGRGGKGRGGDGRGIDVHACESPEKCCNNSRM